MVKRVRQREDEHPIFRRSRNPVSLPSETAVIGSSRGTSVTLAVLIIAAALVAGFLYELLWDKVSSQPTLLLPGSSSAYLETRKPVESLQQLSELDRWSTPTHIAAHLDGGQRSSPFFGRNALGLPFGSMLDVLLRSDSVSLASVPTSDSTGTVVLAEIGDGTLRRKLWRGLKAHLEVTERHLGYDIWALTRTRLSLPWAEPVLPLYFVDLNPFIVIGYGSIDAIHQVLHAKVGTTQQPIRSRDGFVRMRRLEESDRSFRGFLTPGQFLNWFNSIFDGNSATITPWRDLWMSHVSSLSWTSQLREHDDTSQVHIHISSDGEVPVTGSGNHALLSTLPSSSIASIGLVVSNPADSLDKLRGMLAQIHRNSGESGGFIVLARKLRALRSALFRGEQKQYTREELELALSWLEDGVQAGSAPRWVLLSNLNPKIIDEDQLTRGLAQYFGEMYSVGSRTGADGRLHMIHRADQSRGNPDFREMVWRIRDGRLEFGSDQKALEMLDTARTEGETYDSTGIFRKATRSLPVKSTVLAFFHPFRGPWSENPWIQMVTARLNNSFRAAVAGRVTSDTLVLESNMGAWTPLGSLLTAGYRDLNRIALKDLSEPCREALLQLCRTVPDARPCRIQNTERASVARETCQRLGISPN